MAEVRMLACLATSPIVIKTGAVMDNLKRSLSLMIQNMKQLVPMLLCALGLAAQSPAGQPVFACNLKAFQPEERKLHDRLTAELRSAAVSRRELPDGYSFQMDPGKVSITQ